MLYRALLGNRPLRFDPCDYAPAINGMAYSISSLTNKVAFAIAGSLLAMFLTLGHYAPGAAHQFARNRFLEHCGIRMVSILHMHTFVRDSLLLSSRRPYA
jgi:hypothetical protein